MSADETVRLVLVEKICCDDDDLRMLLGGCNSNRKHP